MLVAFLDIFGFKICVRKWKCYRNLHFIEKRMRLEGIPEASIGVSAIVFSFQTNLYSIITIVAELVCFISVICLLKIKLNTKKLIKQYEKERR